MLRRSYLLSEFLFVIHYVSHNVIVIPKKLCNVIKSSWNQTTSFLCECPRFAFAFSNATTNTPEEKITHGRMYKYSKTLFNNVTRFWSAMSWKQLYTI